ncbi:peptide-methionine (S)-S-oxide reductase [Malacoplasma penetrans]|nr:peptide-methionine (S)-S-oxide reductase [Malacoplasma penetrans]
MIKKIYLAGGCFWGIEQYYNLNQKIISTNVGYLNSKIDNPTYKDVCNNITDAVEAVELTYDDQVISLNEIIDLLFKVIDPTSINKQGNDIGRQYRTGIYSRDSDELMAIQEKINELQNNYSKLIQTEVMLVDNYYLAEEYHQKYLEKNPNGYCHINLKAK